MDKRLKQAVAQFWSTRSSQASKQMDAGGRDQGNRSAVTGGKQMDAFVNLIAGLACNAGLPPECVHRFRRIELPGFFRPTKEWDILGVYKDQLVFAVETKSHVGSFGNNFNNRTEEAMGSALDLWTAFREGALNKTITPWLGYVMLLEDSPSTRRPVAVREPHFRVLPEFQGASYAKRYELFCRKLVRERHYTAAMFLTSPAKQKHNGEYTEPAEDLSFDTFSASLCAHVSACTRKD
jgi:hypothetical protein